MEPRAIGVTYSSKRVPSNSLKLRTRLGSSCVCVCARNRVSSQEGEGVYLVSSVVQKFLSSMLHTVFFQVVGPHLWVGMCIWRV